MFVPSRRQCCWRREEMFAWLFISFPFTDLPATTDWPDCLNCFSILGRCCCPFPLSLCLSTVRCPLHVACMLAVHVAVVVRLVLSSRNRCSQSHLQLHCQLPIAIVVIVVGTSLAPPGDNNNNSVQQRRATPRTYCQINLQYDERVT